MKRWKLWTAAILLLLLVVLILAWPSAPRIVISKETTYITEPLKPDGTVDYMAALNQRYSEGVTPENNAAVLFWQAAGPKEIRPEIRDEFFQKLGIAPLQESGDYFVSLDAFSDRRTNAGQPTPQRFDKDAFELRWKQSELLWKQYDEAVSRPWSKEEYPVLAEWILMNEKPITLVIAGCGRSRYFNPFVGDTIESNYAHVIAHGKSSHESARLLRLRAMLRLGEGNVDAAWADLSACHRLGRLADQGPTLIEGLVGVTIEGITVFGEETLLRHAALSPAQIAAMRADLDRLPPAANITAKVLPERLTMLDMVQNLTREGNVVAMMGMIHASDIYFSSGIRGSKVEAVLGAMVRKGVNWNLVLRVINSWYDRLDSACGTPTPAEREIALKQLDADLCAAQDKIKKWPTFALSTLCSPRRRPSEQLGHEFSSSSLSAFAVSAQSEENRAMRFELIKLAFALAAYRTDNDAYPEKLADLVPKYVAEVPTDIFNDAKLHYQRDGDGYLLYSVGPNGRDDGGKATEVRTMADWDDITVRIPAVKRPTDERKQKTTN